MAKFTKKAIAHQTNVESPESVEHLCDKCKKYAREWAPVAEEEWKKTNYKTPYIECCNESNENQILKRFW